MKIRTAASTDDDQIRRVYLAAFGDDEKESVASLARELLREQSTPEILNLVAEEDGLIIGHICFSPLRSKSSGDVLGSILAPLAVNPESQRKGTGSKLVREGLRLLASQGGAIVLVYGDPNYYGRFGFTALLAEGLAPPFNLTYPHGWQAVCLTDRKPAIGVETLQCVNPLNKPELW